MPGVQLDNMQCRESTLPQRTYRRNTSTYNGTKQCNTKDREGSRTGPDEPVQTQRVIRSVDDHSHDASSAPKSHKQNHPMARIHPKEAELTTLAVGAHHVAEFANVHRKLYLHVCSHEQLRSILAVRKV